MQLQHLADQRVGLEQRRIRIGERVNGLGVRVRVGVVTQELEQPAPQRQLCDALV